MAAAQPLQSEPDTLRWPVDFDSLSHVLRTGRMETAGGWKEGGYQALVASEEESNALGNSAGGGAGPDSDGAPVSVGSCQGILALQGWRAITPNSQLPTPKTLNSNWDLGVGSWELGMESGDRSPLLCRLE